MGTVTVPKKAIACDLRQRQHTELKGPLLLANPRLRVTGDFLLDGLPLPVQLEVETPVQFLLCPEIFLYH